MSQSQAQFINAVREVKSGELYRANQISTSDFKDTITKYGIKTLINLRGSHPEESWWVEENQLAEKMGINFVNIPMGAKSIPSRENLIA